MMPASTKAGGQFMTPGPTDVCKTPTPGGPVPMPYPNIAMLPQANAGTCSSRVKICNQKVAVKGTEITMSSGDEPGTAGGGVVSNRFKGPGKISKGSSKVKIEGKPCAHLTSMAGMNGSNANMPAGTQISPSQTKVKVMP
jgi:hypothetical protein